MGQRWWRTTAGSAVVCAAVALLIGSGSSGAQVSPTDALARPGSWRGSSAALGARVFLNTEPRVLPVDDMLTVHVPDAQTSWDSSGDANARASSVFPGQTVVGLPDLLATFGIPQINEVLPAYPLTVFASPTSPDNMTLDGSSRARVDPGGEFVEARGGSVTDGLTEALAPFVTVGPASATSHQTFFDGALVSRAGAAIGEVSLVGGLVRIGSIEVGAEVATPETGEPRTETSVAVGGVSIAGVPVALRPEGIEVAGMVIPPGGFPDGFDPPGLAGQLNELVKTFGLRIDLLGSTESVDGQTARASSNGVLVELEIPVDGPALPTIPLNQLPLDPNELLAGVLPLPIPDVDLNVLYRKYVVSVVIGESRAAATAGAGFGGLPSLAPGPTAMSGTPSAGGGATTPSSGAFAAPGSTSPIGTAGEVGLGPASPASSGGSSLVLLGDRLGVVFAGLVALALGGLVVARASTAPLRAPGQIRHDR